MADFLLELACEEIPARMQAGARAELEKLFQRELAAAGVAADDLTIWSTPRRLALIARGLPLATQGKSEEAKGPPEGAPDAAIDGFCKKNGVTRDQLTLRDVKGRMTWFALVETPGRPMAEVLGQAIPAIIRDFSWPKSMRWGEASVSTESLRWVRPLSGIVALLDGAVVQCAVDGIAAGRETYGHRFHASGAITIEGADDYAATLRAAHVIVDHQERQQMIREGARAAAAAAGLTLIEDDGLVIENAGLTEWPVPLLGRFDAAFLEVPPEVIQLTARVNQKYFVCQTPLPPAGGAGGGQAAGAAGGKLANAFICTANIAANDPAVVVDGNRKVLAARLSDARFFWEQDQKTSLADHAKKLERITFHEKLGTLADKVERVAKLARWLVEEGIVTDTPLPPAGGAGGGHEAAPGAIPTPNPSRKREGDLADLAEQAARLCKADLVTEMVGEFPELQGLMGGYYARAEGLPDEVADAIRDHYKPVGQGDEVPIAPVTVAVSLADKLDTLASFFSINEKPTGSKDPYALRRAAIGVLAILQANQIRISVTRVVAVLVFAGMVFPPRTANASSMNKFLDKWRDTVLSLSPRGVVEFFSDFRRKSVEGDRSNETLIGMFEGFIRACNELPDFFADRLKVQQREAGVRHDLIDAVFALGGEDDLVRLLARVHALQAFISTQDGANLLAGYKRAANILKKTPLPDGEGAGVGDQALSYSPEPAEKALIDALAAAAPRAAAAVEAEQFGDAMAALATLRAPIDRFFDEVTVNAEDADKRAHRLALLARFRDAVHRVADFSRIEG